MTFFSGTIAPGVASSVVVVVRFIAVTFSLGFVHTLIVVPWLLFELLLLYFFVVTAVVVVAVAAAVAVAVLLVLLQLLFHTRRNLQYSAFPRHACPPTDPLTLHSSPP